MPVIRLNGSAADSNGAPVPGVVIQADTHRFDSPTQIELGCNASVTSDAGGSYSTLLLAANGNLQIRPSATSGFSPAAMSNLALTQNVTQRIVLQRPDSTPPVITGKPVVVHLSDTSVSVGWATNEPATSVVEFGIDGLTSTRSSNALSTTHGVTLQDLAPSAIYTFRVASTDGSGNGPVYSSIAFFTTQAPPGDVTAPVITAGPLLAAVAHTSVVLQWTTDEPSTSRVDYGESLTLDRFVESAAGRFVRNHSLTLSGLQPSTTYFARVESFDPDGNGPIRSSVITFTTAAEPDTLAPVISNLRIVSATHNSLTVAWTTNEAASTGVSYNDGTVFSVVSDLALVTHHEVTLAGLTAQKTYNITVSSKDAAGNGPTLAGPIQAATLAAPDTVAPLISSLAADVAKTTVRITWTTNEASTSEVRYGLTPSNLDGVVSTLTLAQAHDITLTGLTPSTAYVVSVTAADSSGNTSTRTLELTTLAEAVLTPPTPPGPVTVSSSPNRTGSFTITWGASIDDGPGGVASYEVFRDGASVALLTPEATSFSEAGLPEGEYRYTVRAADFDGLTADSARVVVVVDQTAPQLVMPEIVETSATTATDAIVTFTVSATDDRDAAPVVVCAPASGSAFVIGDTPVSCTATDAAGNRGTASFTVRVRDPFAPILTVPANITLDATTGDGAIVTYSATATDNADANPTVSCEPPSGSTFPVGTTTVTCAATDASNNIATRSFTVTINTPAKSATLTTLGTSASTVTYGTAVTLTASVSSSFGTPAGTVEFLQGTTVLATVQLNAAATAVWTLAALPAGSQAFSARYVGSLDHEASTSSAVSVQVNRAKPAITWPAALPSMTFGDALGADRLNATTTVSGTFSYIPEAGTMLRAGTHVITAVFTSADANYENATAQASLVVDKASAQLSWAQPADIVFGTPLSSSQLNATAGVPGTFTYSPADGASLGAGTHTLSATFVPADDVNYQGGSVSVTLFVKKATPQIEMAVPASVVYDGQPHPVTANASGIGTQPIGPVTIAYNGSPDAPVNAGAYEVVVSYGGSANYGSARATATFTIARAPSSSAVAFSVAAPVFGQAVAAVVTVSPAIGGTPGGSVTVFVDGQPVGQATLAAGQGTVALPLVAVGSHDVYAKYNGDANFIESAASGSFSVARADSSVTVASSPSPSGQGEPVVLTATVAAVAPGSGTPAGSVQLFVDGAPIGTANLAVVNGAAVASFSTSSMGAGTHALTASYSGDASFNAASSATSSHTVNPKASSTETSLTVPSTAALNAPVTLAAAVSALSGNGSPTGVVEFVDGGVVLGKSPLALSRGAMRASLTTQFAATGAHRIIARYVPDGAMSASSSNPASMTVYDPSTQNAPVQTSTTIQVTRHPKAGAPVDAKVTVRAQGGGTPTGSVDYYADGVLAAKVSLVDGTASYTFTGLAIGAHEIVAVYSADGTFAGSTSMEVVSVSK